MERAQKTEVVENLKAKLARAQSLVMADFRGLTVEKDTQLRNEFRKAGCQYQVVKNTLLGLAVKGSKMAGIESLLQGPTAIAYSFEEASAPAKVLTKFAKDEEVFKIKGGFIEGRVLDAPGVARLAVMPGKNEMRAMFLATLLAVPQNFLRLTTAAQQSFVHLLGARQNARKDDKAT